MAQQVLSAGSVGLVVLLSLLAITSHHGVSARTGQLPSVQPGPSRIVFSVPYSTSMYNMLTSIGQALVDRGHTVEFIGHPKLAIAAAKHNFTFHALPATDGYSQELQDLFELDIKGSTKKWWKAAPALTAFLGAAIGQPYQSWYEDIRDYFNQTGKPDLLVPDFFSVAAIDWAATHQVPYVIFNGINLGFVAGFEDCLACPDPFLGTSRSQHLSLQHRFYKLLTHLHTIYLSLPGTAHLNRIRTSLGVIPYSHPLTQWAGHSVIVPTSWTLDVPRRLSPLTHVVGLLETPFNASAPRSTWSRSDRKLWDLLSEKGGQSGLVYVAFGSEPFDVPIEFLQPLLMGVMAAAAKEGAKLVVSLRPDVLQQYDNGQKLQLLLPEPVTFMSWTNQDVVLAHPAVKVFVTHGGMQSLSEALVNLVPTLVVPFFGDQIANAQRVEEAGIGLAMDPVKNAHLFSNAALKTHKLLTDSSFKASLEKQYKISFAGRPAAQQAADVIERELLVGSAHLVPADERVPFWLAHGLDLIALIVGALLLVVLLVGYVLRALLRQVPSANRLQAAKPKAD